MPNGCENGGIEGLNLATYPLSVWLYHHKGVLGQLKELLELYSDECRHLGSGAASEASEVLRCWLEHNYPDLGQTISADLSGHAWEDVHWGELAQYVLMICFGTMGR